MKTLIVDPEFRDLIQPLTDDEKRELEDSLIKWGCRDSLTVWDGILLDGHNRYELCKKLSIQYETKSIYLPNRDAAKGWIISNQLSRRNLQLYQRVKLVLVRDSIYKAQAKERQRAGLMKGDEKPVPLRGDEREQSLDTNHRLAKEAGVGHNTIHRVRVIENEATQEAKEKLARGETTIHREYNKIRNPNIRPTLTKNERVGIIRELSGQGYRAEQIAGKVGIAAEHVRLLARKAKIDLPDILLRKRTSIDVNRIISETVIQAQSLSAGLDLVDSRIEDLDLSQVNGWIATLSTTISSLNRLIKKLKRANNGQQNDREVQVAG